MATTSTCTLCHCLLFLTSAVSHILDFLSGKLEIWIWVPLLVASNLQKKVNKGHKTEVKSVRLTYFKGSRAHRLTVYNKELKNSHPRVIEFKTIYFSEPEKIRRHC